MDISEKRQLLVDIEALVKRPQMASEVEVNRAIINMQKLLGDLFDMPSLKLKVIFSEEDYKNNIAKLEKQDDPE